MRTPRCAALLLAVLLVAPPDATAAKLQPQTVKAWDLYAQLTERRITTELENAPGFLRSPVARDGKVIVEKLKTRTPDNKEIDVPDGLIHHWFGSVFIPNITVETVLNWVKNYDQHQKYFTEVEQSRLLSHDADTYRIFLRFVRKKIVTVRYNTEHTVIYRSHAEGRASSRSFTTRIAEVQNPGTPSELERTIGDDSGYLWRLNSYWRFKQEGNGVAVECESISLSRGIPFGIGWLIRGFVESVPQESMESTLVSIRDNIRK